MSSPHQKPGSTDSTPFKPGKISISSPGTTESRTSIDTATTPSKLSNNEHDIVNKSPPASAHVGMAFGEDDDLYEPGDRDSTNDHDSRPRLDNADSDPNHPLGPLIRLRVFMRGGGTLSDTSVWAIFRTKEPIEKLMRAWIRDEPLENYSFTAAIDEEVTKGTEFLGAEETPESLGLDDGDGIMVVPGGPDEQPEVGTFAMYN